MAKSITDIIMEVWNSPDNQRKFREILKSMDNINPSKKCVLCNKHCGKEHLLCPDCYFSEGIKEHGK